MATKAKKVVKGKAKAAKAKPAKKGANIKKQIKPKAKTTIKQQPKQKPKSKTAAVKKPVKAVAAKTKKPSVIKKAKSAVAKSKLKAKPIVKTVKSAKPAKVVKAAKPAKSTPTIKNVKIKPEPHAVKLQNVVKLKPVKEAAVKKPVMPAKTRTMDQTSAFAQAVIMSETKPSKQIPMTHLISLGIAPYNERSGEEYMNAKQKEHFQNILLRWKQQLLEEMDRTVHHLQDEAINLPDPNDRASQEEEFNLELRARDRERKLIRKIEEALQKLEDNDYGYCDSCGVEIGIRRLEARATANLCIDCKTLDEIREKQLWG